VSQPAPLPLVVSAAPTGRLVTLDGVPCRLWKAADLQGRVYDLFVHRVGTADPAAQDVLDRVLAEQPAPASVACAECGKAIVPAPGMRCGNCLPF
jgi:hypothetical protein